ncbi:glycosyltransferase family 2 protein [Paenibacillus sp. FSL L8-0708]|uniref:glycosyltransferase family 2 protein n=1 Tax=Paenibacillus sp. FSL L8-0708 TaxID=2975311 RepID=UPI0030F97004
MEGSTLLSIVIPTRNRQYYAFKCVEQILQIKDSRLQVIIQDNSDDVGLEEQLHRLNDNARIKYNYCKGDLSFVDNFSIAVDLADGEYCCIVGDDDGITPYILDVVSWAKTNDVDAIKPEILFEYFWPNSINIKGKADNGVIRLLKAPVKARKYNAYNEVLELLKNGGQHYTTLNMVKLYHGIVRKSCIENIKSLTGKYFGGLSPDIYMAVALSVTAKTVIQLNYPLTIAGVCGNSGSADSSKGRHVGNIEDAPHFRGHVQYEWSELVPKFYSVETIWADSALAALKDLKREDLIEKFRLSSLSTTCIRKHPDFDEVVKKHYNTYLDSKTLTERLQFRTGYIVYPIQEFSKRVKKRLKRKSSDLLFIENINDIISANEEFQKYNISNNITLELVIGALQKALKSKLI